MDPWDVKGWKDGIAFPEVGFQEGLDGVFRREEMGAGSRGRDHEFGDFLGEDGSARWRHDAHQLYERIHKATGILRWDSERAEKILFVGGRDTGYIVGKIAKCRGIAERIVPHGILHLALVIPECPENALREDTAGGRHGLCVVEARVEEVLVIDRSPIRGADFSGERRFVLGAEGIEVRREKWAIRGGTRCVLQIFYDEFLHLRVLVLGELTEDFGEEGKA